VRTDFKRRFLLQGLGGALMAPLLAGARQARAESPDALPDALRLLGDCGPLPRGARRLAHRFRALPAHAGQPNHLLARLRASPRPDSSRAVAEIFARQRREDFRAHRVLIIDGWVLSRAEAELCELLSV